MSLLDYVFYWESKTPQDNKWHPIPGANPVRYIDNSPQWLARTDLDGAIVDVAPFVCGIGGLVHLKQLPQLGWTAPASIFKNHSTMISMHRAVVFSLPIVFLLQAAQVNYRTFIPRWAHEREKRRVEEEVRQQVDFGFGMGVIGWAARLYIFRVGRKYWSPIEAILGGALADLAHREYVKAHGM